MRRVLLLLLATAAAMAGDSPRAEEALASWLETQGVPGAALAIRDREILRAHERSRAFFRDPEPFLLDEVRKALDAPLTPAPHAVGLAAESRIGVKIAWLTPAGWTAIEEGAPPVEGLDALDPESRRAVAALVAAIGKAAADIEKALAPLSAEERAFVASTLPMWITRSRPGEDAASDAEALLKCAALLEKAGAGQRDWLAARAFLDLQKPAIACCERLLAAPSALKETIRLETAAGPVLLLGSGNDSGPVDAALVIDVGGDDEHRFPKDARWRPVRVFLDLGGDDLYLGEGPHAWGAALLGHAVHIDLEGDDDYRGTDWGLGSALGGHALLRDLEGNDRYQGGLGVEGAAAFGTASLEDDSGDDTYVAGCFAQGFGTTGGRGSLHDLGGSDTYFAGRDEADTARRPATWITFAQGAAFGHRFGHVVKDDKGAPRFEMTGQLPGGIGLLEDVKGDDVYEADVFGQGAGYWYGMGVLVDHAGNDRYRATWYGQGVGTHAAVGCLVDRAGDDRYWSRNTSQGCGHDFSAGILWDEAGNDRYSGSSLCQGAGNAMSGLGLLLDGAGADTYRCAGSCWGFGAEEPRKPDAAPYGLFLDLGGEDRFEGAEAPKGDRRQGTRGYAADRP